MKKVFTIFLCFILVTFTSMIFVADAKADDVIYINYIFVDVKGEVENPGVYRVTANTRVFQLIEMAGGLTDDSYTRNVNLASITKDEQIIYIPNINEIADNSLVNLININIASIDLLTTLPNIGESLAQEIVNYRNIQSFSTIEEIMNVSGIGISTFEKIKSFITV